MAIPYLQPTIQAYDSDGEILPGALLYFYEAGTDDFQDTFTSAAGSDENTNPVEADSGGFFPPIFLTTGALYDVVLTDADGAPIDRCDSYSIGPPAASQADVNAGSGSGFVTATTLGDAAASLIYGILGFTPANVAGDVFTGAVRLNYVLTGSQMTVDAAGFRGIPISTRDADYTFILDDAGRGARHTSGSAHAWTLPPVSSVAFPVGATIWLRNFNGGGDVTLTRGVGVALRVAGSGTDGSKVLTANADASVTMEANDVWVVRGVNIS